MMSRRSNKKPPVNHELLPAGELQVNGLYPWQPTPEERAERRRLEQLTGWTHCLVLPGGRCKLYILAKRGKQ